MKWQDIVLSCVNVMFGYSLIPQIVYGWKTKKRITAISTSAITAIGMVAVMSVYISFGMLLTAVTSAITATCWFILLVQGIKYRKVERK